MLRGNPLYPSAISAYARWFTKTHSSMTDSDSEKKKLFWACMMALVATSFVFGVRSEVVPGQLGEAFNLSEAAKGKILGVGLWPFALSIIGFSLIIDRIGYKVIAYFAMICHVISLGMTLLATADNNLLYWGTFLVAIANGAVEAFINPVIATAFSKQKAKWLNILHAGWPLGIALGAICARMLGNGVPWQWKFGICFIPVVIYAVLVLPRKFPPNERVAAGVSYRDMLRQVGAVGFFLIGGLLAMGVLQILAVSGVGGFGDPKQTLWIGIGAGVVAAIAGGIYTGSAGSPMFLVVLLTMPFLATTELGTDTWMPGLLTDFGDNAAWVLAYTAILMTVLRCFAGPIVHKFSPIGLLVISAAVAIAGLLFLSQVQGAAIVLVAVTVYAFGKTFLWSTTLGLVAEQFPKGGALTLNGVSGVGVLGMGLIGSVLMGYFQDTKIDEDLRKDHQAIHAKVAGASTNTLFGKTPSIDADKLKALKSENEGEAKIVESIQNTHKKGSFGRVAVLPAFMLICYLGIFFYFRSKGGYKPIDLSGDSGH